jgi:Holliday junction resolvase RusA-like endonuclease
MTYVMRVLGEPAPQGSKTRTKWGMKESSKKVAPWRENVMNVVHRMGWDALLIDGPVKVRVHFIFTRPKNHFGSKGGVPYLKENAPLWVAKTPDIDKCLRSTFDALTQSGMLTDDSRIVWVETKQVYAGPGEPQGATIEVTPL